MTKVELDKLIASKKEELSKPYQKDEAYDFFKDFVLENKCSVIADFLDIDIFKFIQCRYYLESNNKDIKKCRQTIKDFFPIVNGLKFESFDNFVNTCVTFKKDGKLQSVIDYFEEGNFIKSKLLLKKIYPKNEELKALLLKTKKIIIMDDENNLLTFFKLVRDEYDLIIDLMAFLKAYKLMCLINDRLNFDIGRSGYNIKEKDIEKELNLRLKEGIQVSAVLNSYSEISKFVYDIEIEEEKFNKNRLRELRGLEAMEVLLDRAFEKKEVLNTKEIIKNVKDEKIRYGVLTVIYEHNMKYYRELEEEYKVLCKNNDSQYQVVFSEYNIEIDLNTIDKIKHNSVEDIKSILSFVSDYNLDNEKIINILKNTNLETVLGVKRYLDSGILNKEFIEDNTDLFYIGSVKFSLFLENVRLIGQYGINPYLFSESVETLFSNSEILGKNLEELIRYDLLKSIRTANNYKFLVCDNLSEKIDKLLELGYEKILEEDLELLNSVDYRRLEVLKAMGMGKASKDFLERILKGNFFINDSVLDDYIPSIVSYKKKINLDESLSDLEFFRNSSRTYDFNGVLISSVKVLKLFNNSGDLYDSLFFKTNLSEDEYNLVINCLKDKTFKKQMSDITQ